jgi:hypothetical protein
MPHTGFKSRWIKNPNVKYKNHANIKRNMYKFSFYLGVGKGFLTITQNLESIQVKN